MAKNKNWHSPTKYQIEVGGELGSQWADWFDGVVVMGRDGLTVFISDLLDQPALHGLLIRIRDLGLPLISLERLEPGIEIQILANE
jgi:hypothetical protein